MPRYTVIRDTREKDGHGWTFDKHPPERKYPPHCDGTIIEKLDTGDYSLSGYEDILSLERKDGFVELWANYSDRQRFENEMERMSSIRHSYVIIESSITSDHLGLSPPQYTKGVPGKALFKWLMSISVKYGVKILPAGDCGKYMARLIFEEVVRFERDRWVQSG